MIPGHNCDSSHDPTEPNAFEKDFQCHGPVWGQVFMILVRKQQHLKKAKVWDVEPPMWRGFFPPSFPFVRTLGDTGEESIESRFHM